MIKRRMMVVLPAAVLSPGSVLACAACYGQSDSPMAAGMNWGIFSLLVVVVLVLGGIAACFVSLARRAAAVAAATPNLLQPGPRGSPSGRDGQGRAPASPPGKLLHVCSNSRRRAKGSNRRIWGRTQMSARGRGLSSPFREEHRWKTS